MNSYGKTTLQSDAAAAKQMVKKYSTPIAKQPYKIRFTKFKNNFVIGNSTATKAI